MSWGPLKLRTASTGIVFDGEASPAPGGGSMPIGCVLNIASAIPVSGGPSLAWDSLYDNVADTNPLTALPDGIGFSAPFDGSDSTVTITDSGWYAFTLWAFVEQDATWAGQLGLPIGDTAQNFSETALGEAEATVTWVGFLSAGYAFTPQIAQFVAPTGNPLCGGNMVCVRLA